MKRFKGLPAVWVSPYRRSWEKGTACISLSSRPPTPIVPAVFIMSKWDTSYPGNIGKTKRAFKKALLCLMSFQETNYPSRQYEMKTREIHRY